MLTYSACGVDTAYNVFTVYLATATHCYTTYNVEPSQPNVPTRPPANDNESERGRADLSIWKPYLPLANSTPPLPPNHAGRFDEPLKKWQQNGPELTLTFLDISFDLDQTPIPERALQPR